MACLKVRNASRFTFLAAARSPSYPMHPIVDLRAWVGNRPGLLRGDPAAEEVKRDALRTCRQAVPACAEADRAGSRKR